MATNFDPRWVHNDFPLKSDMAIIVPAWMGHSKWFKYTLNSYKKTGKYIILALDTHLKYDEVRNYQTHFPPMDVLAVPHSIVLKHGTWEADKRNGWLWNIIYGGAVALGLENIKYIFTINSDCCIDKPEGLDELVQILGDADYMPQSVEYENKETGELKLIHSCSVLYKRDCFEKFHNFFKDNLRDNRPESYSPESLLVEGQKKFKFNIKIPDLPYFPPFLLDYPGAIDHYTSYHEESTWKRVLGYRNLCAENDTSGIERIYPFPLEPKYFDLRNGGEYLAGYERESLMKFFDTKDIRYLWMFWDKDEDSWYDRREYMDVNHYGPEPVYEYTKVEVLR